MKKDALFEIAQIFSTGDTSRVQELFGSEYVDHQRPDWTEHTSGPAEFVDIVEGARNNLPGLSVEIVGDVTTYEDVAVGFMSWSSQTGHRLTVEILRFEDSRIVEHWGTVLRPESS